jgi:hypothetical protein
MTVVVFISISMFASQHHKTNTAIMFTEFSLMTFYDTMFEKMWTGRLYDYKEYQDFRSQLNIYNRLEILS